MTAGDMVAARGGRIAEAADLASAFMRLERRKRRRDTALGALEMRNLRSEDHMHRAFWKVGDLARETGLSVRTLHYYDEKGLLLPSHRTLSGHRLYAGKDIQRLQQIKSLRQLGFPLEETRECLSQPAFAPLRVIHLHIARLREEIDMRQQLCRRLEAIAQALDKAEEVSAEQFIQTIEVMNMFDKYFTKEQMEEIKERGRAAGEQRIREVEAEWPRLIAEVRAEMDKGTDPNSPTVQALARRWSGLVNEFTGGNREIGKSVGKMYQEEPSVSARYGLDSAMFEYILKAMSASKK